MCLRYIIEREDAPAQLEKEVGTKRDQGPEGKLLQVQSAFAVALNVWKGRKHTTGISSSWTVLVKGIMWRKQAR